MIEIVENKDKEWNDFLIILLSAYVSSLKQVPKKYYVKSTGQEHRGTTYFQEGIGLTNGFGELLEFR